jgi:hypothetical protein
MNKKQQTELAGRAKAALAAVQSAEKALITKATPETMATYNDAVQARDAVLAEVRMQSPAPPPPEPEIHDASDVTIA